MLALVVLMVVSCKKEEPLTPVNVPYNNVGLSCATCPSIFHEFEDLVIPQTVCDNFASTTTIPPGNYTAGDTLGYSQNSQYPIVVGNSGFCIVNGVEPGLYNIGGSLDFGFGGNTVSAVFEIYGLQNQYDQIGFSVNGSAVTYLDATYPMNVGSVLVDLDTGIPDLPGFQNAHLTFYGEIDEVEIHCFESGVFELCVTPDFVPPVINTNDPVYFTDFFDHSNTITGSYPTAKTRYGYYGQQGTSMVVKFDQFLGYKPTVVSFVHSYLPGQNSRLVNVQLPGTPLIVTVPDSLNYYLSQYGYQVEAYALTNGVIWQDDSSPPISGALTDSVVLKGGNLDQIVVGADLNNSELRSVCSYLN